MPEDFESIAVNQLPTDEQCFGRFQRSYPNIELFSELGHCGLELQFDLTEAESLRDELEDVAEDGEPLTDGETEILDKDKHMAKVRLGLFVSIYSSVSYELTYQNEDSGSYDEIVRRACEERLHNLSEYYYLGDDKKELPGSVGIDLSYLVNRIHKAYKAKPNSHFSELRDLPSQFEG